MEETFFLKYDKTEEDKLDKDSKVLPIKICVEEEYLISDNNYDKANSSIQCIIDACSALGANLIAITDDDDDLENYSPYFVCDMHYHELMTGYYSKQKKKKNNAIIVNQIQ
jgi:hypothetical protein